MSTSPHQPKSLADQITELKEEREEFIAARKQMLVLGQTTSAAGMSTTYPSLQFVVGRIADLNAQIESLTAQLVGDGIPAAGVNLARHVSEYN
jgi:hypothetical protein